jgi:hypothetical protein
MPAVELLVTASDLKDSYLREMTPPSAGGEFPNVQDYPSPAGTDSAGDSFDQRMQQPTAVIDPKDDTLVQAKDTSEPAAGDLTDLPCAAASAVEMANATSPFAFPAASEDVAADLFAAGKIFLWTPAQGEEHAK